MQVTSEAYRQGMRQLAAAVSVVTTEHDGVRNGLTATAVMSMTAEPPRLAVAVNRKASSLPLLLEAGRFAVNVLRYDQARVAARFAGADGAKGEARFEGVEWRTMTTGAPVLVGAAAAFDCEIESRIEVGTHLLLIGAVCDVCAAPSERPLLYLDGTWASLIRANAAEIESYRQTVELCVATVDRASEHAGGSSEKLRSFVREFTAVNIAQTGITRDFMYHEPYVSSDKLAEINAAKNVFDVKLRHLIEGGVDDGEFEVEDAQLTALAITGMISWMHRWYRHEGRLAPNEVAEKLANLVAEMVAATRRRAPAGKPPLHDEAIR